MAQKKSSEHRMMFISDDQMKIPPQAIELEEAVLGALMIEKDAIIEVIDILKPDSFYKCENQKVYQSIINLFTANKAIDILTVPEELRKNDSLDEIGGIAYITLLTNRVASAIHVEHHARIVHQKYIQREIIRYASELQNLSFDNSIDIQELKAFAQEGIYKILTDHTETEAKRVDSILMDEINIIHKLTEKEYRYTGIPSGFNKLDKLTSGWQQTDLVILAARPSMGKTAISIWFGINPSIQNYPVLFFSLEMSSSQLVKRILSYETGINSMNFNRGYVSNNQLNEIDNTLTKYSEKPFYIDDTPALSIYEIQARVKKYVMRFGVKMVIVDYLQLIQGEKNGSRENEVSSVSRGLKAIAKQNNIPVIALSQLNRSMEVSKRKPQLSDLRESGAIEQDADMVIFIDRPYKRGDEVSKEMIILCIEKYRNGATGDVVMYSSDSFNDLREYEQENEWNPDERIEPNY